MYALSLLLLLLSLFLVLGLAVAVVVVVGSCTYCCYLVIDRNKEVRFVFVDFFFSPSIFSKKKNKKKGNKKKLFCMLLFLFVFLCTQATHDISFSRNKPRASTDEPPKGESSEAYWGCTDIFEDHEHALEKIVFTSTDLELDFCEQVRYINGYVSRM